MPNPPRILDSAGTPLAIGDQVREVGGLVIGEVWGYVDGEELGGWSVEVKWPNRLILYQTGCPDLRAAWAGNETFVCEDLTHDLTRITDQEEKRDDD